jgi:hypothetical protein
MAEIDGLKELLAKVGTNPATLEFPTDKWGFTSAVKKEILKAAGSVKGQDDKHDLLLATLVILVTHIKARKDKDHDDRKAHYAELDKAHLERLPREQYSTSKPQE